MPLVRKDVEILLNGGLDTKQASELQGEVSLSEALNVRFNKLGRLERRPGNQDTRSLIGQYDRYGTGGIGNGYAASVVKLGERSVVLTKDYGVNDGSLTPLSYFPTAKPTMAVVSRQSISVAQQSASSRFVCAVSCAQADGHTIAAWVEAGTTTRLRYVALNDATGLRTHEGFVTLNTATLFDRQHQIQAAAYDIDLGGNVTQRVLISYVNGAAAPYTLNTIAWSSSGGFSPGLVTIAGLKKAIHCLRGKVTGTGGGAYIGYVSNSTSKLNIDEYVANTGVTSNVYAAATGVEPESISVDFFGSTLAAMTVSSSSTYSEFHVVGAGEVAAGQTAIPAGYRPINVALGHEDVTGAPGGIRFVQCLGLLREIAVGIEESPVTFVNAMEVSTGVWSKQSSSTVHNAYPITHGYTIDGRAYFAFSLSWMMDNPIRSVMLARADAAQSISRACTMTRVARLGHDRFVTTFLTNSPLTMFPYCMAVTPATKTISVIYPADLDPDRYEPVSALMNKVNLQNRPVSSVEVDDVVYMATGELTGYDGNDAFGAQPLMRPRVSAAVGGAGIYAAGDFYFAAVHVYKDTSGALHRSPPSEITKITLPGATSVDLYITMAPFAFSPALNGLDYIDVYMMSPGETVLRQIFPTITFGSGWATMNVNSTNISILTGERYGSILYTTGSAREELASEPPPSFVSISRVSDRVWGVDAEDRSRIWFSKPLVEGIAPEWNVANTLRIPDTGVAISDVNGAPMIFGSKSLWTVDGDGPNANGDGAFSPARRLPVEAETICPTGVCRTPIGAFFRSRRGVSLLAGYQVEPIGMPIDDLMRHDNGDDVRIRIMHDESANEVRVIDLDRGIFVYNTLEKKWTRWDLNVTDAVAVGNRVYTVHETNEHREFAIDDPLRMSTSTNTCVVETSWVKMDGLEGFGRLRRTQLLMGIGTTPAGLGIVCGITTDYDPLTSVAAVFDNAANFGGISGKPLFLRIDPTSQRVTAAKLRVAWQPSGSPTAYGEYPIAWRLECGVQPGGRRQIDNRSSRSG